MLERVSTTVDVRDGCLYATLVVLEVKWDAIHWVGAGETGDDYTRVPSAPRNTAPY